MPAKRLPWLKFWPELVDHEKFSGLGDSERWTWIKLLARAGQQPVRGRFGGIAHASEVTGRPAKHIKMLIAARLLDLKDDGLWMHDWDYWQRWRPGDDEPTPDNDPSNVNGSTAHYLPNVNGMAHEHLVNDHDKTGATTRALLTDVDVEEDVVNPPLSPAGGRAALAKPKKERTPITDQDTADLIAKYAERYGTPGAVRDEIDLALNHQARFKNLNERLYVDGWLRRELEHRPMRLVTNGRMALHPTPLRHIIDRTGEDT